MNADHENYEHQIDSIEGLSFRDFLKLELENRRQHNPRYSLRAFARWLGYDHSTLAKIIRGERTVGLRLATKLGTKLNLNQDQINQMVMVQKKQRYEQKRKAQEQAVTEAEAAVANVAPSISTPGIPVDSSSEVVTAAPAAETINVAVPAVESIPTPDVVAEIQPTHI